jgi:energy-coupling factor transporter ATP-binding protein EcfA2
MIEIKNLSYRYPGAEKEALLSINLSIPKGQFCGVVGANGAGKSTLCYAISGFVPHFYHGHLEGEVRLDGQFVEERSLGELAGQVGLVFQNPFNQISGARFSVREEIAFGLENLGLPPAEIRQRVGEVLDLVGLQQEAERSPYALSGGQQQRVAIAAIIAMQPQVLVLDEPTSQLDPRGSEEVFATLKQLTESGETTVVIVEHKLEWLASFADRVVVLHRGELTADGDARQILNSEHAQSHGVGRTRYTEAAARIKAGGSVNKTDELPVTLDQAVEYLT